LQHVVPRSSAWAPAPGPPNRGKRLRPPCVRHAPAVRQIFRPAEDRPLPSSCAQAPPAAASQGCCTAHTRPESSAGSALPSTKSLIPHAPDPWQKSPGAEYPQGVRRPTRKRLWGQPESGCSQLEAGMQQVDGVNHGDKRPVSLTRRGMVYDIQRACLSGFGHRVSRKRRKEEERE
jgi:hypothetical protein